MGGLTASRRRVKGHVTGGFHMTSSDEEPFAAHVCETAETLHDWDPVFVDVALTSLGETMGLERPNLTFHLLSDILILADPVPVFLLNETLNNASPFLSLHGLTVHVTHSAQDHPSRKGPSIVSHFHL
jgi:hypothetical protein